MNKYHLIAFIAGFILCFILLKQCSSPAPEIPKASHTITTQTIYVPGPPVFLEKKIPAPYPVYIRASGNIEKEASFCDSIRFYSDTTGIDSTTHFIAQDSIIGKKLWSGRQYFGKPYITKVLTTITDSIPYPVNIPYNALYLAAEMGGNMNQFDFSVGADLITKKRFEVGYRYGITQKTHNIKVGYLIFKK